MKSWTFAKGHGTCNDFVILTDRHNLVPITDQEVRQLCDRRAGIGGDGLLRVTMASSIPEWDGDPDLWFMDYRNADGSIAEMCGNGLRVFVRYLMEEGLAAGETIEVATRAGLRLAEPLADGRIRTSMGRVTLAGQPVQVSLDEQHWPATSVDVGNPHAVVLLDESVSLPELDLATEPGWSPREAFPAGVNVEFVRALDENQIAMRVFERGAGETMSCGTGTVAAAAAHLRSLGQTAGTVWVEVPGGTLEVRVDEDGQAFLTGPAVMVARGQAVLPDVG